MHCRTDLVLGLGFRRVKRGGRYFIVSVEMDQSHALRRSAYRADVLRAHPDQFAVCSHYQNVCILLNPHDRHNLAVLFSGLHVNDAFTTAPLRSILLDSCALTETTLRNG